MHMTKTKYNKLNNSLYKKLYHLNNIKHLKCLKFMSNKNYLLYNQTAEYIKIFNKSSGYLKINYKELNKLTKKLKSGHLILSTPIGVITDKKALLHKTGGVILCYVTNK